MVVLTPEERIVVEAQLADAKLSYHRLMTGLSARVVVDQNGERVEFTSVNKANLYAYIQMLQAQLGYGTSALPYNNSPARFIF